MDEPRALRESTFLRFLIAGGINTLFGFAVYTTCILSNAAPWLALLVGTLAGTTFNFVMTGGYAFRQLDVRRWPTFVAAYLGVYLVNLGLVDWLSPMVGSDLIAQAILLAPMAIMSYLMMARFVFASRV